MKRHPSEPAGEPPAGSAVSSAKDAPSVAPAASTSKLDLPTGEYTGVRRSVFDLLKEKYPDLAPADPKAKSAPAPPKAPVPAPAARAAPPPVEPTAKPEPAKLELVRPEPKPVPAPVAARSQAPAPETPREEPPAIETPRQEPPVREKPRDEPPPAEKPRVEPPPEEPTAPRMAARVPKVKEGPSPAGRLLKDKLRGWLTAVTPPPRPAEKSAPPPEARRPEPAAALPAFAQTEPSAPTPPVLPKAARKRRFGGPSKKVAVFWSSVAALFAIGTYVLASLKPAPAPAAATAVFPDSAAAALSARELSLEPEKVVVAVPEGSAAKAPLKSATTKAPATKAPAKAPAKPVSKPPAKPAAKTTKPAPIKTADAKKTEAKDDSRMVIEPVAPVIPPSRTGGRQPEYPLEARSAGLEGTVVLNGLIGSDGKVRNARVVRGLSPPLDAAALAAFKTWRFKPATQKGKRVEFKYNAGIEFRINSPAQQVNEPQVAEAVPPPAAPAVALPLASAARPGAPLAYGGDFTPPVRVTMVWPQKPPSAQMVTGEVRLQLAVAADGSVGGVEVIEGLPQGVTEAAIEAVRQWKFKPARQLGEPVAVYHRVSLRF